MPLPGANVPPALICVAPTVPVAAEHAARIDRRIAQRAVDDQYAAGIDRGARVVEHAVDGCCGVTDQKGHRRRVGARESPIAADHAEGRKTLILLRATKAAEIKAAAATAAELKRIAAGADDIADNGVSGLKLQRVGAAGEGDGVGLTEEASPAGNCAAVDHGQSSADDTSAAYALQRHVRLEAARSAASGSTGRDTSCAAGIAAAAAAADAPGVDHGPAGRQRQSGAAAPHAGCLSASDGAAGRDCNVRCGIGHDTAASIAFSGASAAVAAGDGSVDVETAALLEDHTGTAVCMSTPAPPPPPPSELRPPLPPVTVADTVTAEVAEMRAPSAPPPPPVEELTPPPPPFGVVEVPALPPAPGDVPVPSLPEVPASPPVPPLPEPKPFPPPPPVASCASAGLGPCISGRKNDF